jgi:hypothetical protein
MTDGLMLIVEEIPAGKYRAVLDGTLLLEASRQPFLDGARELLKRGYDPATPYNMRHANSDVLSFVTTTIGDAADLTVDEARARFRKFRPFAGVILDEAAE